MNGHGITSDYCLAESILSFRLVTHTGEVVDCSRDSQNDEARQLFGLCIGGYGLFGVIYDVTLKVNNNFRLKMETLALFPKDFAFVYKSILQNKDVEIKLARIDITTFQLIDLFVFRRTSNTPSVSNLPSRAKEMSSISRLI